MVGGKLYVEQSDYVTKQKAKQKFGALKTPSKDSTYN